MDPNLNRVAIALSDWKSREERFEKIFSPSILNDTAFQKEKLSYYAFVQAKYGSTANDEEKIALRVLARQRSALRDQLYPSLAGKLYNLISSLFEEQRSLRQALLKQDRNLDQLNKLVKIHGFGDASDKLATHLNQGQKYFTIEQGHYINENEKIKFNLLFSKQQDGSYQFDQYQAQLQNDKGLRHHVSQTFPVGSTETFTADQARQLLAGRAVMREHINESGTLDQTWTQLDFLDKDPSGNHRIKNFQRGYGFDLQKATESLLAKVDLPPQEKEKLFDALARGERQALTLQNGQSSTRIFIEANPQYKNVSIYDENAKKISLSQALSEPSQKIELKKVQTNSKKLSATKRKAHSAL